MSVTDDDFEEEPVETNASQEFADPLTWGVDVLRLSDQDKNVVLTKVYETYANRFLSDNNRIWTTAATMIPLSLLPFVALASINEPTTLQVVALPCAGLLLISVWLIIAQNHRAFQLRSLQRMDEIENIWRFGRFDPPKTLPKQPRASSKHRFRSYLEGVFVRPGMVLYMRFALWGIIIILTLATILWWPAGLLNDPHVGSPGTTPSVRSTSGAPASSPPTPQPTPSGSPTRTP